MEQIPSWEADRFYASQEIPHILWKPKVHHRTSKFPPPVPVPSQINPVHAPHPISWRSTLILSSHISLGLLNGLLPSGFPTRSLYTPLRSPVSATCLFKLNLLDLITRIIFGEEFPHNSKLNYLPVWPMKSLPAELFRGQDCGQQLNPPIFQAILAINFQLDAAILRADFCRQT